MGSDHALADGAPAAPTRIAAVVASSTLVQIVSLAAALIATLATNGILSRYLGPADFGRYALVFAYVNLVIAVFADWGVLQITSREASQRPADMEAIVATGMALQTLASTLSYVIMLAVGVVVGGWEGKAVAIAGLLIFTFPLEALAVVWQVQMKLIRTGWIGIISSVARLAVTAAAVALGAGLLAVVTATTVATAARYLLFPIGLRGCLRPRRLRPDWRRIRPLIGEAWPIAIATTLVALMAQVPVVLLSHYSTTAQVGYFSAAVRVSMQLSAPASILVATMYPLFARLAVQDRVELARLVGTLTRYLATFAVPLALAGFLLGRRLISLLYGPQFAPAGLVLALLTAQAAVAYPTVLAAQVLITMGKQRIDLLILGVGAAIVLPACAVLTPAYGAVGAAAGVLGGSIIVSIALIAALQYFLRGGMVLRSRAIFGSGLLLLATAAITWRVLPPALVACLGLGVYAGALALLGGLDWQDVGYGRALLRRRRQGPVGR